MSKTPIIDRIFHFDAEREKERKGSLIFFSVLICIVALVYTLAGLKGEVIRDYFYYGDALFNGVLPYEPYNDLNWEYPPLSYLFLLIPRLFASDPYGYQVAYIVMLTFFILIGLWTVRGLSLSNGKNAKLMMAAYTLSVIVLIQFFFDRFDAIVAVVTLAAIYLYLKKRRGLAFILIAVGMLIKLYPALLFPIFLMPFFASKEIKKSLVNMGIFIGSSLILTIPFFILAPDTFFGFISYHSDRGLQLESVAASFISFLEIFGLTSTQTNNEFWAFNIEGGLADAVVPFMMPLLLTAMMIFYFMYYIHCSKENDENERFKSVVWASLAVVLIFVIFNKVFSAQYMVWIMLIAIPMLACYKDEGRDRSTLYILMISAVVTLYFGLLYTDLYYHKAIPILLLLIRNLLIIAILIRLLNNNGMIKETSDTIKDKFRRFKDHNYDG